MEKEGKVYGLCPCGRGLIERRPPSTKIATEVIDNGKVVDDGENDICSVCGNHVWVPFDEEKAISFVKVSPFLLLPAKILKNINCPPEEFWKDFEKGLKRIVKQES